MHLKKPFFKETIYVSDKITQEEVFEEVYLDLLNKQFVTEGFLEHLIERERNCPTGLDLSPISNELPNIAIPHTESDFVRTTRIVPIKLTHELLFNNMISPDKQLSVKFLFMILNEDGEAQAGMLAEIMDFINAVDRQELCAFFDLEDIQAIYQFLEEHFTIEISA